MGEEERSPDDGTPLGRYVPDGDGSPPVRVVLRDLPVALAMASREHHDDLLREYRLLALSGEIDAAHAPARLVELVEVLGGRYAQAHGRRDEELEAAHAAGRSVIDQVSEVPAGSLEAVRGLRALMEESDRYCEEARLLTVPRPPLLRRFGEWFLGEYERQLQGHPPTPWDGPLQV
ncbi:hypothetical protein [Aquipuribacter sp. SD81]|uniref:hypothetical protein n=1 Tax=Aquipuribacter sp. SD81 TaxID=3127703 RepID=UPI00301930AA